MKTIKRTVCAVLALILIACTFSGCHQQGEVAMTFGEGSSKVEITSALYLCNLIQAYQEGMSEVDAALAETEESEETAEDTAEEQVDYLKQKIDGKDFTEWVEEKAMENLKKYAAVQTAIKDSGVTLTDEQETEVATYTDYYWNTYGYSTVYEKNGVGYETFKTFRRSSTQEYAYFDSIYGTGGGKEVAKKEIMAHLKEHYVPVNVVAFSKYDNTTGEAIDETEVATMKKKFTNYADQLDAKEISFAKVYEAINGAAEDGSDPDYSSYVGDEETDYAIDDFKKVKKLGNKKCVVIEDDYGIYLYQKLKIDDENYQELQSSVVYSLKNDEFQEEILRIGNDLKLEKNNYALKRLKVKNIDLATDATV